MAEWDSVDCLARCRRKSRRPVTDESYGTADWYADMTEAQAYAIAWLVTRAPEAQYGAPVLLTSSDGGQTYGFGTDADGDPEFPLGHCEIYASKRHIPDEPLEVMIDFMLEGRKIRIPADRSRTFADGPYARFVLQPRKIDASNQPTLQPKTARLAIVSGAVAKWASRPGSGADPTYWEKERDQELEVWLRIYRTQYNMQAALGNPNSYLFSIGLLTGRSG